LAGESWIDKESRPLIILLGKASFVQWLVRIKVREAIQQDLTRIASSAKHRLIPHVGAQ
jgi:hypothetical protein